MSGKYQRLELIFGKSNPFNSSTKKAVLVAMSCTNCICCGPLAIQYTKKDSYQKIHQSNTYPIEKNHVRFKCTKCSKSQSYACVQQFVSRACESVPKYVLARDPFYLQVYPHLQKEPETLEISVSCCIGCCFSSLIPEGTHSSTFPLPSSDKLACRIANRATQSVDYNEHAVDHTILPDMSRMSISSSSPPLRKETIEESRKHNRSLQHDGSDNMKSHCTPYHTVSLEPPRYEKIISLEQKMSNNEPKMSNKTKKRQKKRKREAAASPTNIKVEGNQFVGAMYFPLRRLIDTTHAHNKHLRMDLLGLAKSNEDGNGCTPGEPHMVLNEEDATALNNYYKDNQQPIPYINPAHFTRMKVTDVESPEDTNTKRSFSVAHAIIPQEVRVDDCVEYGQTQVPLEELIKASVFSYKRTVKKADVLILSGDYRLEPHDSLRMNGRKLLCCRAQSLASKGISDLDATKMYYDLAYEAGWDGIGLTRTSGTNGYTNNTSHRDLLRVLHANPSLLPNKAGACWIIPHKKYYYILYSKHTYKSDEPSIGCTTYAPPKPGGSLLLNGNAMVQYPILGEMAYLKMYLTLLLKRFNAIREDEPPVAIGPISHELRNIQYARGIFKATNGNYFSFCKAFISVNSMSLVTHPVGLHNDFFSKKGESLENKICFVVPSIKTSVGRGGSLIGNQFVYALLDWQYGGRHVRQWYVNHSVDLGLGQPAPRFAQRSLNHYFTANANTAVGQNWIQQFNDYMSEHGNVQLANGLQWYGQNQP